MSNKGKWGLVIICLAIGFGIGWYRAMLQFVPPVADRTNAELAREFPAWWDKVPFMQADMAQAVYPWVYLPEDQYDDFNDGNVSDWLAGVFIHERLHLEREVDQGPLRYGFKYLTSKDFRLEEELLAIQAQMAYLHTVGGSYDIEEKATQFAGEEYREIMEYESAVEILTELWQTGEFSL